MTQYLARRLLISLALVVGAATLVFALLHLLPGDPVRILLGEFATEEQIVAMRRELGLDRPLHVQYAEWLINAARGDFGTSLGFGLPVRELILTRLPRTAELAIVSMLLALAFGIPFGILSALHRGRIVDTGLTIGSLIGLSVPNYVTGTLLVLVFAVYFKWVPPSGYTGLTEEPVRHMKLLILPSITLALHFGASIARMTRSSVLEVLTQDYVRTARGKGLRQWQVIRRHVLRNSLIPVTTIAGLQVGGLLGGTVIVEAIFGWPGLGTLLFQGVTTQDYPVVQGTVLVTTGLFVLVMLTLDVVNGLIDPRIAHGRSS